MPNYLTWGQCLGPVLLLWYLVVLLSHGRKNKKKITACPWHTKAPKSIPFLSFYPITSLLFVPALSHAAVHNHITVGSSIMECLLVPVSSPSPALSISLYLFLPMPPPSFQCKQLLLRSSPLLSMFFSLHKVSFLIYSVYIKSCKLHFSNLIIQPVKFWLFANSPHLGGLSLPSWFSSFFYLLLVSGAH